VSVEVLVGLIDSGVGHELGDRVAIQTAFVLADGERVERISSSPDAIGHGSSLARTILLAAPSVRIVSAQVFHRSMSASPAVVAAALRWLVEQRARLVNMSFGVRSDRDVLRAACAAAHAAGAILLAAAPARGSAVFPAAYPDVIRVSGDARCAPGEVSFLGSVQADFGACPRTEDGSVRGASAAVAQLCGRAAAFLAEQPDANAAALARFLDAAARYRGPERRGAPADGEAQTRPR
jgi:subtilisin family serine protease